MHSSEREKIILERLEATSFVSFQELERVIDGSPATIRRDLERLAQENKLIRVRGGAKLIADDNVTSFPSAHKLAGAPFSENIKLNIEKKRAIGKAAASFCVRGEGVMIDGGTTTFQMCPHLKGLNLQVLTNSLHIVNELINQAGTRLLVPSGTVFPEQAIILSAFGEDGMPKFHAPKLFMGAGSIGPQGLLQTDVILVAAERRLIERAEKVFVLADSTKFKSASGNVVCGLDEVNTIITDSGLSDTAASMIEKAGVRLIVADGRNNTRRGGASTA
jgi:DeoR family ulaG and ulaABCDEF operon transcriptional repressor